MSTVRVACPEDAHRLTAIALAAKRHWGYSEELISLWQADLTVLPQFMPNFPVFCAVRDSEIVGFYALLRQGEAFELEHLWVDPQHMGTGVGALLFQHAVFIVRSMGGSVLNITSTLTPRVFTGGWAPHAWGRCRRGLKGGPCR